MNTLLRAIERGDGEAAYDASTAHIRRVSELAQKRSGDSPNRTNCPANVTQNRLRAVFLTVESPARACARLWYSIIPSRWACP